MPTVARTTTLTTILTGLVLLLLLLPPAASGQVIPSLSHGATVSVFGNFTYGQSDWSQSAIYGPTIGSYLQTSHFFGFEARASALRYGALAHQYAALAGPRVAMHFSRFTPYVAGLAGIGRARWQGPKISGHATAPYDETGFGAEWSAVGGVDFYAHHRISIRLGEVSYSKIYVLQHGLTPYTYSGGVVIRLPYGH